MAENKMKGVAKLLGLELEEEFRLEDVPYRYKLTECGLFVKFDDEKSWHVSARLESLLTGKYQIVKIPKQILTEKEKDYLSSVIKPFRDRIIYIAKKGEDDESEYIEISLRYYVNKFYAVFFLPDFKKGTMYKGMKNDNGYTLEELGL